MANQRKGKKGSGEGAASKADRSRSPEADALETPSVPKWLPPTLFVVLTLYVFRPFVFSDEMLFGSDTMGLGYVARALYAEALATLGSVPGWAPQILGGTPFLEALSAGDSLYPPSVLLLMVMEPYRALGWKLVIHVAMAGFFMFGWIRAIGASRAAALVASVGYMLAPFFVTLVNPGHDGKMFVTALAPLLFWAVERHFVSPKIRTFSAISLVIGLVILTTHFQMAYFLFGGVGLFAIFRTVQLWRSEAPDSPSGAGRRPAATRFAIFLAASLVGAGVASVQLLPAYDYINESSRRVQTSREAAGETSVAWSSSWSMHPEEAMSLVIPEFVGGNVNGTEWTQNTYWGRNFFKYNHEYVGLVLLLLAAVSFVGGARSGLRWFFTGLGLAGLLFALGQTTPVWRIFYEVVPGVSYFRASSQVIFLFGFSVVTLAALGVDRLFSAARAADDDEWKSVQRVLWGGAGAMGVLLVLTGSGALTSLWTTVLYSDIEPGREQALQVLLPFVLRGAAIAFTLSAATAGLTWALRARHIPPIGLLAGLVLLVSVDALRIDAPYVSTRNFEEFSTPSANIQAILDRERDSTEPYRLLSFRDSGQDVMPALHGIELAAGHHPNDLLRYRELIGMAGSGSAVNLGEANIRRLLNVKYILWPDLEMGGSIEGPVIARLELQDGRPFETIFTDPGLPRARLVGSVAIKSDEEAVPYMLSEAFDPEVEVVLTEEPPLALQPGPITGSVEWVERGPDRMRLAVTTDKPAMLVIADNWFPAWRATVDGGEVPVMRAYHSLRAVPVPIGDHSVELYYKSDLVSRSLWLSIVLFLAVTGAAGFDLWRDRRKEIPA
jgi:hypothetical protein